MKSIKVYILFIMSLLLMTDIFANDKFIYVANARFYTPDGKELALWGVNFQSSLSWEFGRLKNHGVEETTESLNRCTDVNLAELVQMATGIVRCHLTPADFTDENGNIVESPYIANLDYLVSQAAKMGIYVHIALINHMGGGYIQNSMLQRRNRRDWIHDPVLVEKCKTYITQLLNRVNTYNGIKYKDNPAIAMWEIINEPSAYSYDAIKTSAFYEDFKKWIEQKGLEDNSTSYAAYRMILVRDYINSMYDLIRSQGDVHPVVWSLNWHRYRNGNIDLFDAAVSSKVEAVAFCNYPGQDNVGENYGRNPKDLTEIDFAPWFAEQYREVNGYRWALTPDFMKKAKIVYEFETFFNQSSYLYPIQALFFRSLGVQDATMWTYTPAEVASYVGGSHYLSLLCTPGKTASYMIANEIFKSTPLYNVFDTQNINEQVGSNYAISKSRDLSIFSDKDKLIYSRDITGWCPLEIHPQVKIIIGRESSSLVSYSGSGLYFITVNDKELSIVVNPNIIWKINPAFVNLFNTTLNTELDYSAHSMSINLTDWEKGGTLYKIDSKGARKRVAKMSSLADISLTPGRYIVVK